MEIVFVEYLRADDHIRSGRIIRRIPIHRESVDSISGDTVESSVVERAFYGFLLPVGEEDMRARQSRG